MEISELQKIWQQYDARLAENTRINKEILKRMLRIKPEKRINRMKGWEMYGIIVFVLIMCFALIPNVKFRNEWDFYLGLALIVIMSVNMLYLDIQRFSLIRSIDFTNHVTQTKKQLLQLDTFKLKEIKWGFLFGLIGMVGVCLMCQIPVKTKSFVQLTVIIILCFTVFSYIHFKRFKRQLNCLNAELGEIESLEKE